MPSDDEQANRPERPAGAPERSADSGSPGAGPGQSAHDEPDELPETIRSRLERLVPELVKKTFAAGLGAVFSTEEGIRKIARESLPEVAGYIASSADGAKDKVFDVIARETREFLANLNVSEEIAKILTTLSFEIKTEIRFIPNSERFVGAEPDVKASVRLKRNEEARPESRSDRKDDDARSRLRFWNRDRDGGEPDDDDPSR
ncbi:MAG TPA: hypothetical protein VFT22_38350 [Kofleriaceae bacterium]|nr:hypothetical protein [Kofleriaceae bacterium]